MISKASHRDGTVTISGPMTPKKPLFETDIILFKQSADGGLSSAVDSGSDDESAFRGRREPRFSGEDTGLSKFRPGSKRGSVRSNEMIKIRDNLRHERSVDSTLMMSGEHHQSSGYK